jgi:arylsulfatase A
VYDGGIREPTVMWWPGKIPANTVCREVAASIDLLPTLAGLSGAALPARKIDGKNIWPLMVGEADAKSPHEAYVLNHAAGAVRSGKWKFYPWAEGQGRGREAKAKGVAASKFPVQLYDTRADIGEKVNRAEEFPEVVARLQKAYTEYVAEINANKRPTAELERPKDAKDSARPGPPRNPKRKQAR